MINTLVTKITERRALLTLFFFNDTPTTEIYTLSLHDALPISSEFPLLETMSRRCRSRKSLCAGECVTRCSTQTDRKSKRLNSSHQIISYAVFCLKKKKYIVMITTSIVFPLIHVDTPIGPLF